MEYSGIRTKGEKQLCDQYHPMPFMETEVEGVDLTEGKKEHEEYPPRKGGLQRQKKLVTEGTDEHREPEGVGIKEFTHKIGVF